MNAIKTRMARCSTGRVILHPAVLMQPCGALRGTRCSIYKDRPECCRTFECGLLSKLSKGAVTLAEARSRVRELRVRIKSLSAMLQKVQPAENLPIRERYLEAQELLANRNVSGISSDQLAMAMGRVDQLIRREFLTG